MANITDMRRLRPLSSPIAEDVPSAFVPDYALETPGGGDNGNGTATEGAAIGVVGSDGKLNLVPKHSTWVVPTTYPTELLAGNASDYAKLFGDGVRALSASYDIELNKTTGIVTIKRISNGKSVTIDVSSLTRDMSIRTISICDGGVSKSMDILASAPY